MRIGLDALGEKLKQDFTNKGFQISNKVGVLEEGIIRNNNEGDITEDLKRF